MLLVAAGIAATLLISTAAFFVLSHRQPQNDSNATPAADSGGPRNQTESLADLDWDPVARDLEMLTAEVNNLQSRADQLWDRQPATPVTIPAASLPEAPMEPTP